MRHNEVLYNDIEKLRGFLNDISLDIINDKIHEHKEIVFLSEKLDKLIVEYILSQNKFNKI